MGKEAATVASGKKRSREQQQQVTAKSKKQAPVTSSSSSDDNDDSSSDSDNSDEDTTAAASTKPTTARDDAAASDDSSSDSDDSDSETENALFRPAPTAQPASDNDDSDSSNSSSSDNDSDSSDSEDDAVKPPAPAVPAVTTSKKTKAAASTTTSTNPSSSSLDASLQDEMDKKTEATVYVEGIPYQANEGDVVSHFASCGIVTEVRMPRWNDSGRPRGYAHVVFASESSLPAALALDGAYLFSRYLTVKRAETPRTLALALDGAKTTPKQVAGCKTVFIKQLPYDVDDATIHDALASCGTIVSVRLPLWNHTKKLKGFGYVEFATEAEAIAAVKRSGMKIGGRMVLIALDSAGGAPKASFRQVDGQYWNKTEEAKKSLAKKLAAKAPRSTLAGGGSGKRNGDRGAYKKHKVAL